ncbi:MAG: hypothetical protein ACFCU6_16010, partial [Balneolaceae bacterium]
MLKNRDYIGISFEGPVVRFAKIRTTKKGIEIVRLDKLTLVNELAQETREADDVSIDDSNYDAESIFGIGEEDDTDAEEELLDLGDLETGEDEAESFDLVDEAEAPSSNEM